MKSLTYIINIEDQNVRTIGTGKDGNINFYEAGIDGLTDKDEIIETLEEMNDCAPEEVKYDEIIVEFE